ncbi:hypothetical protein KDD93_06840 [Campylobacter sp. faydin G-24]|uniref:Dit-like phage tail protein N-terminal domain-containing protein n=1 Tax=Campylobacter anatolicus TaxID=2829105 RepID=A0ABS5HJ32_9BACT|nr:hypothetical protein [Campylobacter anatolicus]MBR8464276.1 hypothetical protein [Campylobacter anatolicus]
MIELINRNIGKFILDGVVSENNKSTLRISKNPIESGANIADHAILEPKQITIKGVIVAYEPPRLTRTDVLLSALRISLPRIKTAHKMTQRAIKLKTQIMDIKSKVDNATEILGVKNTTQAIAPFLPDFLKSNKDNTQSTQRIQTQYAKLLNLQKNGETLEVQTGVTLYKNMLITGIEATTEQDLWLDLTLSLEEVFIVNTQIGTGLSVKLSNKVNLGKTQLEKPQSMLNKIAGSAREAIFG